MRSLFKFELPCLLIFSLLSLNPIHALVQDPLSAFPTQKVAEHTWVVVGPLEQPNVANQGFMNNPAFVITDKSVVVFDPGSSVQIGEALLSRIKKLTNNPVTHVFNSHVHGDHWLANDAIHQAYPNVKIYAHPQMIEEATNGEGANWLKLMNSLTEGATDNTKLVLPTDALEDQQIVTIDNIRVKSHLSELSHTKTDAMFEIIEDKVLITGDNGFNQRAPRMDDGSYVGNIDSMQKGLNLDITTVIPGHGNFGGKEILNAYRDFLETIYEQSKILLDEDLEDFEMKPIIIEKLGPYKDWANFDESIGRLISIAVLEAENE